MKNLYLIAKQVTFTIFGIGVLLISCKYEDVAKANYPEQLIYLPAAVNGVFSISSVVSFGASKYAVDLDNKKLNIPLGVARSGVSQDGDFSVDIKANTDTITTLIVANMLPNAELFPAGKYTIPTTVNVGNGQPNAPFTLSLDLNYLRDNPTKKLAIAVTITSNQRKTTPKLNTAIILIDAGILKPTADFKAQADAILMKKVVFTNTSLNAVSYSWDFGDGSAASSLPTPTYTYAAAGSYAVTLTATGITGSLDAIKKTVNITVQ